MALKKYHLTKDKKGNWDFRAQGAKKARKSFKTKKDAMTWIKKNMQKSNTSVAIHLEKGPIQEVRSYPK